MTPKQKAKELFDKYYKLLFLCETTKNIGKQCALLAAEEIWTQINANYVSDFNYPARSEAKWNKLNDYWEEVKIEIEKL